MKIVVCIKQVPDTSDIKWTENNTISREGVESILNPMDLYAVNLAVKLKSCNDNAKITVVSMGPLQAMDVIKKAIALGCDSGILLSDRKFAGADTYATAKTLAHLISKKVPDFDLIVCGQYASDGDTAQTGPSLARQLNIPAVTYVKSSQFINDKLIVTRETEIAYEKYEVALPSLLCVSKGDVEPGRAKIQGFINAKNANVEILNCEDVDMCAEHTGIKGSPTYVSKAFTPKIEHNGEIYICDDSDVCAKVLVEKINEYV